MKKAIATKWVKALRSGKYKQGRGCLLDEGKYCCLGVLCEVVSPESRDWYFGAQLTKTIAGKCGIKSLDGALPESSESYSLSILNDSGVSFETIAKIIEDNWEDL